jgi:hypothetical protein
MSLEEATECETPTLPATPLAIPMEYERIELEDQGTEVLVPAAYARMLRRQGKRLEIDVELDPEPSPLPPLKAEQQALLDYLKENGVTSSTDLAGKIGYEPNTIKNWCGPRGPLRAHGVISTKKGYAVVGEQ